MRSGRRSVRPFTDWSRNSVCTHAARCFSRHVSDIFCHSRRRSWLSYPSSVFKEPVRGEEARELCSLCPMGVFDIEDQCKPMPYCRSSLLLAEAHFDAALLAIARAHRLCCSGVVRCF